MLEKSQFHQKVLTFLKSQNLKSLTVAPSFCRVAAYTVRNEGPLRTEQQNDH